jgi:hypothetical protein
MNDYLIASGTLFSFLFALCWSYYMATRVIPPKVISQMESKYSDPEWLTNMFSTSWDLMGDSMGPKIQDSIMKSLRMSTLRDIRTLGNDVETLEDEVIDRLPDTIDAESAIKMLKIAKKRPDLVERIGEISQILPLIQQLGGVGAGGGAGPVAGSSSSFNPWI